jgi:endoglucanase
LNLPAGRRRRFRASAAVLSLALAILPSGAAPAATAQNVTAVTKQGSVGVVVPLVGSGPLPLSFVAVTMPRHGAALLAGALAAYTPSTHFSGSDSFQYEVVDGAGQTSKLATVRVTVEPVTTATAPPPYVTISGDRLVGADGRPFFVKGLIVRPVIAPFFDNLVPFGHFDGRELVAAHRWGANTIRLLTSQPALDPQNALYSEQYIQSVENAAQQVLDHGFVLIIGVNDESTTGETVPNCLPTAATERAWLTLLALPFAQPRYAHQVMLETFNEPVSGVSGPTLDAFWWQVWQNGGDVAAFTIDPTLTCVAGTKVGMNALVAEIRQSGARNVVIADGLGWAHWLDAAFPLIDGLRRLAYAAHPFLEDWPGFHLIGDPSADDPVLDAAFGNMRQIGPVVVTAVGGGAESSGAGCEAAAPRIMPVLLDYLRRRGFGAIGWAFDLPPSSLTSDWHYHPTSYARFRCPQNGIAGQGGPGGLLRQMFAAIPD